MKLFTPTRSKRLNEVVGLVFLACALLLLISLSSYHFADRSWNTATAVAKPLNLAGPLGSYVADLFLQMFGAAAFLFPIFAMILAWRWVMSEAVETPIVRVVGAILFLTSACAGVSMMPRWHLFNGLIPLGGVYGLLAAGVLLDALNATGASIVIVTALIVSAYLLSSFSLDHVTQAARALAAPFRAIAAAFRGWRERSRERSRQRAQERAERRRLQREAKVAAEPQVEMQALADEPVADSLFSQEKPAAAERIPPAKPSRRRASPVAEEVPIHEIPIEPLPEAVPAFSNEIPIRPIEDLAPWETSPAASMPQGKVLPFVSEARVPTQFRLPSTELLNPPQARSAYDEQELKNTAAAIKSKFEEFNVLGSVVQINPGPVVTTFEFKPEAGIKYSRITTLTEDLCLGLQAESILIERIPGKPTVGIEVPNVNREVISLRQMIESDEFTQSRSNLTISLGKDINGRIKVAPLETMPHVLIAGSTGSGKSVMINSLVMSILYKSTPDEVRMIMIDPKRVELGMYEGIPHLLTPVITDPRKATYALKNAVLEMERRLRLLAEHGARNIDQFNKKIRKLQEEPRSLFAEEEPVNEELKPLPYILILIDELADLMILEGRNVEESVTRLAQMARAVGMHLVLATQRPSVDVITGLIKANFPARISFRVATRVDSRTILDVMGAEHLLGKGDMLFLPPGSSRLTRVHGAFVTETEINGVVDFWKAQAVPDYDQSFLMAPPTDDGEPEPEEPSGDQDPMYEEALRVVMEMGKASTSTLQRRLRLGYGRAARILDMMHKDGIIGPPDGSKPREVLKRPDWLREVDRQEV
ncbi:MAG TPA: cell division protein FtsK [Solibacterales bacterium]|nr:cell division protein FtsK [Bryobacterales bacterium]